MSIRKIMAATSLAALQIAALGQYAQAQIHPRAAESASVKKSASGIVVTGTTVTPPVTISSGQFDTALFSKDTAQAHTLAVIDPKFRAKMLGNELTRTLHDRLQSIYEEYDFPRGENVTIGLTSGQKILAFNDVVGPAGTSPRGAFAAKIDSLDQLNMSLSLDYPSIFINGSPPTSPGNTAITSCAPVPITGFAHASVIGQVTSTIKLKRDNVVIASNDLVFNGLTYFQHHFDFNQPLDTGSYTLTHYVVPFGLTSWQGNGNSTFWFPLTNTADCTKDVSYQAHVKNRGWGNRVTNGISAGTTGERKRMEAVKIRLLGDAHPNMGICYTAHVKDRGWLSEVCNGATAGTTGERRRMEAIRIRLVNAPANCSVQYRTHIKRSGWMPWVSNNAQSGFTNRSRRMEDIQVRLTQACLP